MLLNPVLHDLRTMAYHAEKAVDPLHHLLATVPQLACNGPHANRRAAGAATALTSLGPRHATLDQLRGSLVGRMVLPDVHRIAR